MKLSIISQSKYDTIRYDTIRLRSKQQWMEPFNSSRSPMKTEQKQQGIYCCVLTVCFLRRPTLWQWDESSTSVMSTVAAGLTNESPDFPAHTLPGLALIPASAATKLSTGELHDTCKLWTITIKSSPNDSISFHLHLQQLSYIRTRNSDSCSYVTV